MSDHINHPRIPLIFISHDTRDAELAEAFSKLLSSVSAGVLKSFRSSDKKGNQGIEYGVEWYPEIMKKLESASDVVCLLTPHSVGRPWILYEAGVAKGKMDTPVHGLALGVPLQTASTGPFAQFQNSDDSEDALTQLVMQLVRRIPNAEPDRDVVKMQVASFREKALKAINEANNDENKPESADSTSVAKLFEEVKVMFQDLPLRIEKRIDPDMRRRNKRRYPPPMLFELADELGRGNIDGAPLLFITSQFRDDVPWLYDLSVEINRQLNVGDPRAIDTIMSLDRMMDMFMRHPMFREFGYRSKENFFDFDEVIYVVQKILSRLHDALVVKNTKVETTRVVVKKDATTPDAP